MEFFKIKKDIPFMKHALVFNAISFLTFAVAVFLLNFVIVVFLVGWLLCG